MRSGWMKRGDRGWGGELVVSHAGCSGKEREGGRCGTYKQRQQQPCLYHIIYIRGSSNLIGGDCTCCRGKERGEEGGGREGMRKEEKGMRRRSTIYRNQKKEEKHKIGERKAWKRERERERTRTGR